jgi:hypothetical protein
MNQKPDNSECFCIKADDAGGLGFNTLERGLKNHGGSFNLTIPLPSIGSTQDPGDIAQDYIDALFVGEMLSPFCDNINYEDISSKYSSSILFSGRSKDIKSVSKLIHRLIKALFTDDSDDDEILTARGDLEDEIYWQTVSKKLKFPELADDYMANLLHASAPWENEEYLKEYNLKFPETKYGFWKSFISPRVGFDLYCSTEAWIAPPESQIDQAFREYGICNKEVTISMLPATIMSFLKLSPILVNDASFAYYPDRNIQSAVNCSEHVSLFKETGVIDKQWFLSANGNIAIFQTCKAQHIAFCDSSKMDENTVTEYLLRAEADVQKLRRALGMEIHTRCNWEVLNDERFELLCYDVLRRCGKFDPNRIRKMGKARSRDGGRDLIAFTKMRPGHPSKKWIVQCKFVGGGRSLSGSMVQVSDVIDQYEARGFAVMTNAFIDATLYDKLESICNRRRIEHETWSGLEIERFLQKCNDLLRIYFKKD